MVGSDGSIELSRTQDVGDFASEIYVADCGASSEAGVDVNASALARFAKLPRKRDATWEDLKSNKYIIESIDATVFARDDVMINIVIKAGIGGLSTGHRYV